MLILKPSIHETIWGGSFFCELYNFNKKIGHLYSCDPQPNGSIILNGEYKGMYLYDYLRSNNMDGQELQFVIAIVTPDENLSIQVHPSVGKYKKNEAWYFIKEPDCKYIYNGCKSNSKEYINKCMEKGEFSLVADTLGIKKGDFVYIQGGTMHAMTAGSIVYEIEELNGKTYRFYDYNRKDDTGKTRELQLEEAMLTLDTKLKSMSNDSFQKQGKFEIALIQDEKYVNNTDKLVCITLLEGRSAIKDLMLGMSAILEPNEEIETVGGVYMLAQPTICK